MKTMWKRSSRPVDGPGSSGREVRAFGGPTGPPTQSSAFPQKKKPNQVQVQPLNPRRVVSLIDRETSSSVAGRRQAAPVGPTTATL